MDAPVATGNDLLVAVEQTRIRIHSLLGIGIQPTLYIHMDSLTHHRPNVDFGFL